MKNAKKAQNSRQLIIVFKLSRLRSFTVILYHQLARERTSSVFPEVSYDRSPETAHSRSAFGGRKERQILQSHAYLNVTLRANGLLPVQLVRLREGEYRRNIKLPEPFNEPQVPLIGFSPAVQRTTTARNALESFK